MKIVLAPNAFKECMTAHEAAQAMARGVRSATPEASVVSVPMADGGDSSLDVLVRSAGDKGRFVDVAVSDPLGRKITAKYGLIDDGRVAVIEMALASGLALLNESEKNPLNTTTVGTGQLLAHAFAQGVSKVIMCIGGSATNDGGCGMAHALGYRFFDEQDRVVEPIGRNLSLIKRIDSNAVSKSIKSTEIVVACDVQNPLLGPNGATEVYGPQKGATKQRRAILEDGLKILASLWKRDLSSDASDRAGSGAAGGLGGGLVAFCGARLASGFDIIAEQMRLEDAIRGSDLVITGEGKIDKSTAAGKVPSGVATLARRHHVPCVAIGGAVPSTHSVDSLTSFSLCNGPMSLEKAMGDAPALLEHQTHQVVRLFLEGSRLKKSKL